MIREIRLAKNISLAAAAETAQLSELARAKIERDPAAASALNLVKYMDAIGGSEAEVFALMEKLNETETFGLSIWETSEKPEDEDPSSMEEAKVLSLETDFADQAQLQRSTALAKKD